MVQQMAIYEQGCKVIVSVPLASELKGSNPPRQEAGQNILHF